MTARSSPPVTSARLRSMPAGAEGTLRTNTYGDSAAVTGRPPKICSGLACAFCSRNMIFGLIGDADGRPRLMVSALRRAGWPQAKRFSRHGERRRICHDLGRPAPPRPLRDPLEASGTSPIPEVMADERTVASQKRSGCEYGTGCNAIAGQGGADLRRVGTGRK